MYDFYPYFTNDGSVGLYSPEFNDIYHSATGALSEAYDKFIYPSNIDYLLNTKNNIKVLDICYGIGYNTKAFLNYINEKNIEKLSKKFSKCTDNYAPIYTNKIMGLSQRDTEAIYSDNILQNSNSDNLINVQHDLNNSIGTIYSNNTFPKIYIKAIDYDKNLSMLSPFIKTGEKNYKKYKVNLPYDKINKYLQKGNNSKIKTVDEIVNFFIYDRIIQNLPEIFENNEIISILNNRDLSPYFDKNIRGIFDLYKDKTGNKSSAYNILANLHNIYYQHVSLRYKKRLKTYWLRDTKLDIKNDDARKIILDDNFKYNLIFLDAFTPSKCPCLWSYEFFKLLFEHLENDGMLLTYSSSVSVRAAMLEAGFYLGNIYNETDNKFVGTIAAKNKTFIKHELSECDLGLLNTKAGIFYRDANLNASNEAIIKAREIEVKNSSRMSSSAYKNQHKS